MADRDNPNGPTLVEALGSLKDALVEDKRQRALSSKDASKADKLLIKELKQSRKASNRKPAGFAKRVGKRAIGGVTGAVGDAIGGIPIVGTILKVLGQEFKNARNSKKEYQKILKNRRKVELKEMERLAKAKAKLESKANEKEEKVSSPKSERGLGGQAVERLTEAAMHLQATAISMTPAIQTFHETVERMADVVEQMQDDSPAKIRDAKVLEYLYAIEFLTQEQTAITERGEEAIAGIGKDIGNIKWHMARANGSVGRIEKLLKDRDPSKVEVSADPALKDDVGKIKWHVARINGSNSRIEKLLQKEVDDRLKMLDNQKKDLELQKKQTELQDDTNTIGIIGAITNLFGGVGTGALAAIGAGAMVTLGAGAAAALGVEIGNAIRDWIPDNDITDAIQEGFGRAVDKVLAFFGDDDAKERLKMWEGVDAEREGEENLANAWKVAQALGIDQNPDWQTKEAQDWAREHGEFPMKDRRIMFDKTNRSLSNGWTGAYISDSKYPYELDREQAELDAKAAALNNMSAEVDDAKNMPTQTPQSGGNVVAPSSTTNNNTTVQPGTLSASPSRSVQRDMN